jgi:hypothetical protein
MAAHGENGKPIGGEDLSWPDWWAKYKRGADRRRLPL